MERFLSENFLLKSQTGKRLYREAACNLPIVDYHCHIDPADIASDRIYRTPSQLWLDHDHYKWRLLRSNGVDEAYITGDADDFSKFEQWAKTLEKAAGNPLYLWSHMELKHFFGYEGYLKGSNAAGVWDFCMKKIGTGIRASDLLRKADVRLLCTTDDPVSDLSWHREYRAGSTHAPRMLPTFRPDRILAVENRDYPQYTAELSACAKIAVTDFESLRRALDQRMDYFSENGCRLSDHSLSEFHLYPWKEREIDEIMRIRAGNGVVSTEQQHQYRSAVLCYLAGSYARRGWAMQLHFGVHRNVNSMMFATLGADTGFDCIGGPVSYQDVARFLDTLHRNNNLPRTVIYSIDPGDNAVIDSLAYSFHETGTRSLIQHGAAWWFNDHKDGIRQHLSSLAAQGLLGTFIGMLTDSRSLLSYVRHDYFRRILCEFLGDLVDAGEYPNDPQLLETLVKDISYRNSLAYFGLEIDV